jgi:hypothetical protein
VQREREFLVKGWNLPYVSVTDLIFAEMDILNRVVDRIPDYCLQLAMRGAALPSTSFAVGASEGASRLLLS